MPPLPKLYRRYDTPANSPANTTCWAIRIPDEQQCRLAVWEMLGLLSNPKVWDDTDGLSAIDTASLFAQMFEERTPCMIGIVMPYATKNPPPGMLECNGGLYLRTTYPALYAVLDPAFIVDADSFRVPNMADRFPLGMSGGHSVGELGGQEEVGLSIDNLPSHTHVADPHSHNYTMAVTAADAAGEVPLPGLNAAIVSDTTPATVNIGNTGGNREHDNMPPYIALRYGIVAQ